MGEGKQEEIILKAFVSGLLDWNRHQNSRKMPWKGEKDPYKIWLSEIILQQTRVAQGLAYYQRFIASFPTVFDLARAPEKEVFKLWEGLGYYTRCRNLIQSACYIAENLQGVFPSDYPSLLALKGVGTYTAAAIASFAYNLPHAVLDGNVFRVLARIYGSDQPVDTTEGKHYFTALAQKMLPVQEAGVYNQAIMDFGATLCKPMPECAACFFRDHCTAFNQNRQLLLPVKVKSLSIKTRWFHYYVLQVGQEFAIWQRTGKDIWQNLYEPLLLEAEKQLSKAELLVQLEKSYGIRELEVVSEAARQTQRLTHQKIHFSFLHLLLLSKPELPGAVWVPAKEVCRFPFPKTIQQFLAGNLGM